MAAAAAVVVAIAVVTPTSNPTDPPIASPSTSETSSGPAVLELDADLDAARLLTVIGSRQLGALENPEVLAECLRANGIEPSRTLLGSGSAARRRPGVLLLLAGPQPPQITALVVGNSCSATNPATMSVTDIG